MAVVHLRSQHICWISSHAVSETREAENWPRKAVSTSVASWHIRHVRISQGTGCLLEKSMRLKRGDRSFADMYCTLILCAERLASRFCSLLLVEKDPLSIFSFACTTGFESTRAMPGFSQIRMKWLAFSMPLAKV